MTDYRFCTVADEGRLRIVTINRPEVMNALHSEAHWEFDRIWNEFAADPELWVGIITGAGERAFSAGKELGFVNEIVPEGQALEAAKRWAAQILECSPMAIRASKQSVYRSLDELSLQAAMTTTYPAVKANLES